MKRSLGMVLIFLLVICMIISILVIAQWQSILLFQKFVYRYGGHQKQFMHLDQAAHEIMIVLQHHQPASTGEWVIDHDSVHYELRLQGTFPCIQWINEKTHKTYSTEHYILTLQQGSSVLMCRLAKFIPIEFCLDEHKRFINSPMLSWNYKP